MFVRFTDVAAITCMAKRRLQLQRSTWLAVWLVAWLVSADAAVFHPVQVESLRYFTKPDSTQLVFDTSVPATDHQMVALRNPDRLIIDVAGGVLAGSLPQAPVNHPAVRGVRAGIRDREHLRLIVDLKKDVMARSRVVAEKSGGHQLVVELYGSGQAIPLDQTVPTHASTPPVAAAIPTTKASVLTRTVGAARPVAAKPSAPRREPSRQATAPVEPRDLVIAIDAGHGGDDPGAHGANGTDEKYVTLAIARRLADLVRQQPGMKPLLIRNGDYYVGLRQRIQKARKHKADLFVSIHADAYASDDARGSSVFTLSEKGATSEAAKWLAERENAADLSGVSLKGKDDVLASVLFDLSQTATQEASQELAQRVLRELSRANNLHYQQVQRAGFAVLKSPDVPSILVETAFISNPEEERKLRDSAHQQLIARSIFSGIRGYLAVNAPPGTRVAAQ